MITPRILIVEDSDDDADLLLRELRRGGIEPEFTRVDSAEGARRALAGRSWDIVLSDFQLPKHDFRDILSAAREHDPDMPFIVVSGSIGEENAISLMREGVVDFVFKGNLSRLVPAIQRELAAAAQQQARREADQRFRDIVEVSGDWIWETGPDHRYTFFSSRDQDSKETDPSASLGKSCWELAGADPVRDEHWRAHLADLEARRPFRNFLYSFVDSSGTRHHLSFSGVPVFDRSGVFKGYRGTATDETRVVEAFWRAEQAETLLRDAVESISEGFLILDPEDRVVIANDAFRKLYADISDLIVPGIAYEDLLRTAVDHNIYPDARGRESAWVAERLEEHRDLATGLIERLGDGRWVMVTERRMSNGGIAGLTVDVTALKKAEAQRDYLAYHDPVTGLPNHRVFTDRLGQALGGIRAAGTGALAVASIELLSLGTIRDSAGLEAGDAAIREVAKRLSSAALAGETVAHIGAGHFLVLRNGLENERAAASSVEKLLPDLQRSFEMGGVEIPLRIAMGVSTAPGDGLEADAIVRNATTAMHKAKSRPTQRYQFYNAEMTKAAVLRASLEGDLRRALERDELFLAYQPQVDTHTYKLVGAEALVRWQHPERGVIPPNAFIPLAEETGLILPMGEHVFRLACRQAKAWRSGSPGIPIAVNLSAVQLQDPNLRMSFLREVEACGLSADAIRLELTESAILQDVQAATKTMRELAEAGIGFALDDFGMEHSALSHLSDLPFDTLKIDRSFVSRMTEERGQAALFQAIISMTHSLGMTAVAEGVELPSQLIYLQAYGCDIIQGYLFGKPMTAEDFGKVLQAGMLLPSAEAAAGTLSPHPPKAHAA